MNEPVEGLMRLGLTEYEARAYVATVSIGEGGIAEISQQSGMPRSRVYDVMERLAKKGFVEVGAGKPLRYRAVDPDKVTEQIRLNLIEISNEVQSSLKDIRKSTDRMSTPLWFIQGDALVDMGIREFLDKSRLPLGMIVTSNRLLLKHAAEIKQKAETHRLDVIMTNEPEKFIGLLGKATLLRMPPLKIENLDWIIGADFPSEWERDVRNEMVIVSGSNSMIVYKEHDSRAAIRVEGTIIGQFIYSFLEGIFHEAEPLELGERGAKTVRARGP